MPKRLLQVIHDMNARLSLTLLTKQDTRNSGNGMCAPIHIEIVRGDFDAVKLLIDHGADVNAVADRGMSPAYAASDREHLDNLKLLVILAWL